MTPTLHEFVLETFSETELLIFCDNNDEFKKIKAEFSNTMPLGEKTRRLINFCKRHGLSEVLRDKIKDERKEQWGNYKMPEKDPVSNMEKMRENKRETENIHRDFNAIKTQKSSLRIVNEGRKSEEKLKVFISYATEDKKNALALYEHLQKNDFQPWIDRLDLLPGQKWEVEILKAIETSDIILICLSENSVTKEGYVQKEMKIALDKALEIPDEHIFLIPVRLDNSKVPRSLKQYQWVDLFERNGSSKLLISLQTRAEQLNRIMNKSKTI